MSDHDDDGFVTYLLHVKAFGAARAKQILVDSAADVAAGRIPERTGVTFEVDPGGGPYGAFITRTHELDVSPMNADGYPGESSDD